ncbi:hypothetical protein AAHE18_07G064600 [Arachis hypogaea]
MKCYNSEIKDHKENRSAAGKKKNQNMKHIQREREKRVKINTECEREWSEGIEILQKNAASDERVKSVNNDLNVFLSNCRGLRYLRLLSSHSPLHFALPPFFLLLLLTCALLRGLAPMVHACSS